MGDVKHETPGTKPDQDWLYAYRDSEPHADLRGPVLASLHLRASDIKRLS